MMQVRFLIRYSPAKGQRIEAGTVVEIEPEVAVDLIQRGIALPVLTRAEHAVAPGQGKS